MKLLLTTFLFVSTICFSQKQYEFDYIIEYELISYKDPIKIPNHKFRKETETSKKYYLTNSNKNNYIAIITDLDSLNYQMVLRDQDGIYANVKVLKSELFKAEVINIDCNNIIPYINRFKYQTKNYDFFRLKDTVLNTKTYSLYKLASIRNTKRIRRKKIGTEFYIIDKETSFHLPILSFGTAYEEWKTDGNLPNGIFFQKFFIDYNGNLDAKEKLINYWKTDKKIVINDDCDYTKKR
jgi:hypothetical protein